MIDIIKVRWCVVPMKKVNSTNETEIYSNPFITFNLRQCLLWFSHLGSLERYHVVFLSSLQGNVVSLFKSFKFCNYYNKELLVNAYHIDLIHFARPKMEENKTCIIFKIHSITSNVLFWFVDDIGSF